MNEKAIDVLLVEDNPNDEMLTLHAFKKYNFANRVHVARDGVEALEFLFHTGPYEELSGDNPALILLDKNLPLMDGLEVLRTLRADPRTSMIPVVMLTCSAEDRDIIESYELGVNSYLVKPVDFDRFCDTVRKLGYYWMLVNKPPPGSFARAVADASTAQSIATARSITRPGIPSPE